MNKLNSFLTLTGLMTSAAIADSPFHCNFTELTQNPVFQGTNVTAVTEFMEDHQQNSPYNRLFACVFNSKPQEFVLTPDWKAILLPNYVLNFAYTGAPATVNVTGDVVQIDGSVTHAGDAFVLASTNSFSSTGDVTGDDATTTATPVTPAATDDVTGDDATTTATPVTPVTPAATGSTGSTDDVTGDDATTTATPVTPAATDSTGSTDDVTGDDATTTATPVTPVTPAATGSTGSTDDVTGDDATTTATPVATDSTDDVTGDDATTTATPVATDSTDDVTGDEASNFDPNAEVMEDF